MKLSNFKLALLSPESLYNRAVNQVYKSKIDLIHFSFLESPVLRAKLLNRISNENCKIVDYCNYLSNIDTSQTSLAYTIPTANIIQNFFSDLNQNDRLYDTIVEIDQSIPETEATKPQIELFLRTLKEDFELRSGINYDQDTKTRIGNAQAKIEELCQKFSAPLTYDSRVILFPSQLYEKLPANLQKIIDTNMDLQQPLNQKVIKARFYYNQLMSLFLTTDLATSREMFHGYVIFPRYSAECKKAALPLQIKKRKLLISSVFIRLKRR